MNHHINSQSPSDCTPLITPDDCKPLQSAIPTPPPAAHAVDAPHTDHPGVHPQAPSFGHGPKDLLGGHLPVPGWSWGDVGNGLIVTGGVALAFVVVVTMLCGIAWMLGWQPARARNWALGSLVLPLSAIVTHGFEVSEPLRQFTQGASEFLHGSPVHGMAMMAILVVPAAWMFATWAFTSRLVRLATQGFADPARTERAMWARGERQRRAATRLSRYQLPFTTGGMSPDIVFGRLAAEELSAPPKSKWRALGARTETRLIIPWIKLREHMVLVANSGAGKTTLMLRLLLSWFVTAWMRHRQWWRLQKVGRPLGLVLDCNGGPDSVATGERVKRWAHTLGVPEHRAAVFPQDVQLDMWGFDPEVQLQIVNAMISGGSVPSTDTEKYFYEIRLTLLHLIIEAPERVEVINGEPTPVGKNPPRNNIEFLSRFDPVRLCRLWGGVYEPDPKTAGPWTGVPGVDREIQATLAGKQPVMDSARSEFGNLFRALGDAFDGDAKITDFDFLYCVLEGASQPDRARAQFAALGVLLEQLGNIDHGREALMIVDEFSAVSNGKNRADAWVMRMRKAHIGTLWIAQDWNGLGYDDEQRESLIAAGAGGAILGRQERGSKLCETFGTSRRFELSRKLVDGTAHGDEGNIQPGDQFLISPNTLRTFQRGDIAHVSGGRVRRGHISPLDDSKRERMRPLSGLSKFTEITSGSTDSESSDAIAPVIDLSKRRPAS